MKQFLCALLCLLILSACSTVPPEPSGDVPESPPAVQPDTPTGAPGADAVPPESSDAAQPEPEAPVEGFQAVEGGLAYYVDGVRQSYAPGVQTIDGCAYLVLEDGATICAARAQVAAPDGVRRYFEDDSSLRAFRRGFVELPDGTYYAAEDGYALAPYSAEVVTLDGCGYAFDEAGRVLTLEPGVQQLFGTYYYVDTAGTAIAPREAGVLRQGLDLYYVQTDGRLLTDGAVGYLTFGSDGRYTSGSAEVDQAIADLFGAIEIEADAEAEDLFRAAYAYLRDNYTYLSMAHQVAGTTDWTEDCALTFFDLGKGNCYCWAAAVMYCGRQLGYQAYVVAGWESNPQNEHAWVMVDWPDGERYLFDAELEYAYWYMFNRAHIDMFRVREDGGLYNGFAYYFPS